MTDVVERIDELIAEQKCWHCERSFHRLPLTKRVAAMFDRGRIDSDYFASEDTTPIVCDGSTFIGPIRPEPSYASGGALRSGGSFTFTFKAWLPDGAQNATLTIAPPSHVLSLPSYGYTWPKFTLYDSGWTIIKGGQDSSWLKEWFSPPKPVCAGPVPDVDVEFGPQNWQPREPVAVPTAVSTAVVQRWQHFATPEPIPVPTSRGYDFTAFQGDEPKYPTSKKGKKP